jgi:hypothetical protein
MSAGAERLAVRSTILAGFALVVFLAGVAFDTSLTQVGAHKHSEASFVQQVEQNEKP